MTLRTTVRLCEGRRGGEAGRSSGEDEQQQGRRARGLGGVDGLHENGGTSSRASQLHWSHSRSTRDHATPRGAHPHYYALATASRKSATAQTLPPMLWSPCLCLAMPLRPPSNTLGARRGSTGVVHAVHARPDPNGHPGPSRPRPAARPRAAAPRSPPWSGRRAHDLTRRDRRPSAARGRAQGHGARRQPYLENDAVDGSVSETIECLGTAICGASLSKAATRESR